MSRFCIIPWTNVYVHPNGDMRSCCHGSETYGNIYREDIKDILVNEKYTKLRSDFLDNKIPKNCMTCHFLEKSGYETQRITSSDREEQIRHDPTKFTLELTDIRWGNECNLSCVYCSSENSSIWEKIISKKVKKPDDKKLKPLENFLVENNTTLKRVNLVGGEPLLLKQNVKLLDSILPKTYVNIITNLSIPNLEKNKVFQKLQKFDTVEFRISFENIGDRFEYVRYGAKWETFEKNLRLVKSIPNFRILSSSTYNILSALRVMEFYDYCADNNLEVKWVGLVWPRELNAFFLPPQLKEYCIESLEHSLIKYPQYNNSNIQAILNSFKKSGSKFNDLEEIQKFLHKQENLLKPKDSYKKLWPELDQG